MSQEIIDLTQSLLDSIVAGDWETYEKLCDSSLTCFEPEAEGHLVSGLGFHKFYFEIKPEPFADETDSSSSNTTISSPHVRMIGDSVAVISYVRLIQKTNGQMGPWTQRFEETRIWEKKNGEWQHVHFHRSRPAGGKRDRIGSMGKKIMKMRRKRSRRC